MKGSLTATTFTAPCSTLVSEMSAVALQLELRKKQSRGTYALRKTILPIRPKPLIPTSVSDILIYGDCEPSKVRRGFEEGICRVNGEEKKLRWGWRAWVKRHISLRRDAARSPRPSFGGALNCKQCPCKVSGRWRPKEIQRTAGQK